MQVQDIAGLVLVYAIIGISLGLSVLLERRGADDDTVRKAVHAGVGFFILVWWMFTEVWIMAVFFTLPFAAILLAAVFKGNRISDSRMGELSTGKGHRWGLFLYVVSLNILVFLFPGHRTAATIGVAAMTFGDAFGSIIGKRYGRHRTVNGKSLEGSLGVFAFTFVPAVLIMLFYGYLAQCGLYSCPTSPAVHVAAAACAAGTV